ncbi:E3 ubiquitin-protein ligase PEP5 [Meyerozyma sp. JA9]|nr:E3 ubiquitin-protein ligase PEP5 [Meyerozyma sp. JA9]
MAWRQFQLFDTLPIRDPNYRSNEQLYSDPSLSAVGGTSNYLVIAVKSASLKVINKQMEPVGEFQAYDWDYRITFVKSVPSSDLVLTIAEKLGSPPIIKLWDLHKVLDAVHSGVADTHFKYHTMVAIHNGVNSYPISCFSFNHSLTCLAIGYTNGKVVLVRGDLIRDRGSKQRIVYDSHDSITGVHFNKAYDLIYVTTTSRIVTVQTTGRNYGQPSRILSKKTGVDLLCSTIDDETQNMIVATPDSIRYYSHLRKLETILLDMPKKTIHKYHKNYLLIVSLSGEDLQSTRVVIIDLVNKHISFSLTIPNASITHVFTMWDDIYLLDTNGLLYQLHEKPINQQIEIILQRQLFSIAHKLAVQWNLSKKMLLKIERQHGDHLYESGSFEESIQCYARCLNFFDWDDTSDETVQEFIMSIIIKFKDVSNTKNLTQFLASLTEIGLADNDHITLLLCCYCKLQMVDELDKFIENLDLSKSSSLQNLNFQLIINLFKECQFYPQVIKLLNKLDQPNLIVAIQLNDLKQPNQCLKFVKGLPVDDLLLILIEHSKQLLEQLPLETTELLINVFTGSYKPIKIEPTVDTENGKGAEAENTGTLSSYMAFLNYIGGDSKVEKLPEPSEPTYMPPRASLIFSSFINNPYEFVIFLEACIHTFDKYQGNSNDKKDLLITLFERYLSLAKADPQNASEWSKKANALLGQYPKLLDRSSVLLLSHINGFQEGEKFSQQQSGFEESLFQSAQIVGDIDECFSIVKTYGDAKPALFMMLLRYMVSSKTVFNKTTQKDMSYVLQNIQKHRLATPIEVVRILSSKDFTTLGLVKDYLIEYLDEQSQEISNNEKLIQSYESESTKNTLKLNELKSQPFLLQNNKCSMCHLKLDFPMVHFKCKHSYHQRCLNENTFMAVSKQANDSSQRCPLCFKDFDQVSALREEQLQAKDQEQEFQQLLEETTDRFKLITDYLGRGVMEEEYVPIVED